jgi:type IV pilus biogenesis protein CpaD/CtpE
MSKSESNKSEIDSNKSEIDSNKSEIDSNKSDDETICNENDNLYNKKCKTNKLLLRFEEENRKELMENPEENRFLYPNLNDPYFNIKISQKKEFSDTKYDGTIFDVKEYANILSNAEYELLPHQAFVRNFMSFQTPYNSLLLFHGLGSGKTCSAIGVCEEMRLYLKQMGINKKIIIVASPNVQDNFRLQLFDERKLKLVDGIWNTKGCLGNNLLKEINPTGMKGLKKEKVIQQIKHLINESYHFTGYIQFSNDIAKYIKNISDITQEDIIRLQNEFSNNLIVIDEVHNIRISNDNENKNTAKNLMFLVSIVNNIRLLLLSATPMFNSYKEIIWLINLMNMNDKRGIISISDIFDNNGEFKSDASKELFLRKLNGYVSYVRGENPYTFPFRIYPNKFAPDNTFKNKEEYPKYQINGKIIPDDTKIEKLSLYLTNIGSYQKLGYKYIISRLQNKLQEKHITKSGKTSKKKVKSMDSLNYIDLQLPIQGLNIIYPYDNLEDIVENIRSIEQSNEEEKEINDISPSASSVDVEVTDLIDDVIINGPQIESKLDLKNRSEIESEPYIDKESTKEIDSRNIKSKKINKLTSIQPIIFEEIEESINKLSDNSSIEESQLSNKGGERLFINARELTGVEGLRRVMNYDDSKTPSIKGNFEYKEGYEHIFATKNIGKYSSKIKNICESIYNSNTNTVSDGIILIYSSFIDAGLIPVALALEEMGFIRYGNNKSLFKTFPTNPVDVRTMKPSSTKKDLKPATYIMITGDSRLSPNNDADLKAITSDDNINGERIKVVLISQAGSEGLDFKAIRQVHILEPWYNLNRIEQIIGRAVRNFSHKDLPFEKRNVEIYLYGTILDTSEEEAADLYVYRISELKAIKIGKITRLMKQISVDCLVNLEQSQFTIDNFNSIPENLEVTQIVSTGQELINFEIGDNPNSATCDYMNNCEYKCLPDINLSDNIESDVTYNENFMLVNSDKIIQKIKGLMRIRFFYNKKDLFSYINTPKKYPTEHIYAALSQIINDNTEYITDKYGRTGYLINIGDYYLFQPSELKYPNISIFQRSVPLDFKHNNINFEINTDILKPVIDKRNINKNILEYDDIIISENLEGKMVLDTMYSNYRIAMNTTIVERGTDNWYKHCGVIIRKMLNEYDIPIETLELYLINHICDILMLDDKLNLLNYLYINNNLENNVTDTIFKRFIIKVRKYLETKVINSKGLKGILIFNGSSRIDNLNIYILNNENQWIPSEPEDRRDLQDAIIRKYRLKDNLNKYIGFIGFETHNKYMVYKIKDTENMRSTGFRCDQSGKIKIVDLINDIENDIKYNSKTTKENNHQLCILQEFLLRYYEEIQKDELTWFVNTETAIINEFEKKEKK